MHVNHSVDLGILSTKFYHNIAGNKKIIPQKIYFLQDLGQELD